MSILWSDSTVVVELEQMWRSLRAAHLLMIVDIDRRARIRRSHVLLYVSRKSMAQDAMTTGTTACDNRQW